MQVSINDYCGTKVLHVFKLSGESAKEGEDFAPWRGAYHKNGKWSYTEGGVAMRNGILLLNRRSTHRKWNDIKVLYPHREVLRTSPKAEKPARGPHH